MKEPIKRGEFKFGLTEEGKKFNNDSNPTPNLQNKKLFDLAFKSTYSKLKTLEK
jgi:hypothetical protein